MPAKFQIHGNWLNRHMGRVSGTIFTIKAGQTLRLANDAVEIQFSDTATYISEKVADQIVLTSSATQTLAVAGNEVRLGTNELGFGATTTGGQDVKMSRGAANRLDFASGDSVKLQGAGQLLLSVTAGITADTLATQGDGALTAQVNEVSVCATAGDAVTLPTAVGGESITIRNNGAAALAIFPASGDDLGAGVNTARSPNLPINTSVVFTAFGSTTWEEV